MGCPLSGHTQPTLCAVSADSAMLVPIDPLPSLSTMLKWEGPFRSGVPVEAEPVMGCTG